MDTRSLLAAIAIFIIVVIYFYLRNFVFPQIHWWQAMLVHLGFIACGFGLGYLFLKWCA